jgi:ATP-dependent Clp protease ATP-binding subunit ClpA
MKFHQLAQKVLEVYPALVLESVISRGFRLKIRKTLLYMTALVFVLMILNIFPQYVFHIRGALFILFSLWILFYLLESMFYSYYFSKENTIDFEVAKIVLDTKNDDITKHFLDSSLGSFVMIRLGISKKEVQRFLSERKQRVTKDEFMIVENDADPFISISEYARSILHFDIEFANFLRAFGVDGNTWKGVLDWIAQNERLAIERSAWWHRDRLSRVPSIGHEWAYGQIYKLEKYGYPISSDPVFQTISGKLTLFEESVNSLERILAKQSGANILLIAGETMMAMQWVSSLGKEVENGTVRSEIEGKKVYVLDTDAIIDSMKEKVDLEAELNSVMNQVMNAGNVILVIKDLPHFIVSADALDVDVKSLLAGALSSERLQVIAISSKRAYHETVETAHDLTRYFEKIIIPELGHDAIIQVINNEANIIESQLPVFFTYQSLQAVVKSAERFFADDTLYDKAVDILNEVATDVSKGKKLQIITKEKVEEIVEKRTGIPQGEIKDEEKDKLNNLENILHKRIVGQDLAINSISSAIRRARAGLTDSKRPTGSFLFLGPTGVGKTETTKALAEVFFGSEDKIMRVDMSEYSSDNALEKLIGSFESDAPGFLTAKIRESQYGVLLLDEFEKSRREVQDLFLQILDEGFFTDGRGEKVNARNLIIIATSNAGSALIYDAIKQNKNVILSQQEIVDKIIQDGVYRPELLNRFDGVIVFHPLDESALSNVVKLMLNSLNQRLSDKNITILETDELISYLVKIGIDPKFGARAVKRTIQDVVEKKVADAMIKGDIVNGDKIKLIPQENGDIIVQK